MQIAKLTCTSESFIEDSPHFRLRRKGVRLLAIKNSSTEGSLILAILGCVGFTLNLLSFLNALIQNDLHTPPGIDGPAPLIFVGSFVVLALSLVGLILGLESLDAIPYYNNRKVVHGAIMLSIIPLVGSSILLIYFNCFY